MLHLLENMKYVSSLYISSTYRISISKLTIVPKCHETFQICWKTLQWTCLIVAHQFRVFLSSFLSFGIFLRVKRYIKHQVWYLVKKMSSHVYKIPQLLKCKIIFYFKMNATIIKSMILECIQSKIIFIASFTFDCAARTF